MQRRAIRSYSDVMYVVQALAKCLYPYYQDFEKPWIMAIYETAGITVERGEEPTLSQLYLVEAFLLDQLQQQHQEVERMLEYV